uniref:TetR family transcriptional regulator n=1 Tax=Thermosporothrix sp. COM3 TaxID=2490863 RepID=A0A455SPN8_9CHLR|nr:TetR family transcriptional regulator [Thermosporothrix sp. COM3]
MRRTKEEAAITREQLLKAALRIFYEKGYNATTLEDIARAVGSTRGAVYWHFGGKAELFNAVIREQYHRAWEKLQPLYVRDDRPLRVLRRILIGWMLYPVEDADFRIMQKMMNWQTVLLPEMVDGMQEKREGLQRSLEGMAELLRMAKENGEARADLDVDATAFAAMGLIYGITDLWMLMPDQMPLQTKAEEIVDGFIRGISR